MLFALVATLSLALTQTTLAASGSQWASRSIYQVLTDRFARTDGSTTFPCNTADRVYCGGTFKGIQNQLDYIQNMGFDAVWISPVTAQLRGKTAYGYAYHGYWQRDLYEINPQFGTSEDLRDLSDALHERGMYLMVDIVVNHNGARGPVKDIDYGVYNPFDAKKYYHPYCLIDFNDINNAVRTHSSNPLVHY
jgi:alpha-amylase